MFSIHDFSLLDRIRRSEVIESGDRNRWKKIKIYFIILKQCIRQNTGTTTSIESFIYLMNNKFHNAKLKSFSSMLILQNHLILWVQLPLRASCTTLCDIVCQWLAVGRWFSLGPSIFSINKTDCHDITEILLKVALNTIKPNQTHAIRMFIYWIRRCDLLGFF
jgi:hypothetical protein